MLTRMPYFLCTGKGSRNGDIKKTKKKEENEAEQERVRVRE